MKERINEVFNALAIRMKQNLMKYLLYRYFEGQNANSVDPDKTALFANHLLCKMQQTTSRDKVFEPFFDQQKL